MIMVFFVFFFKQKKAYEITRRDWSSDVCSSDLPSYVARTSARGPPAAPATRVTTEASTSGRSEERRVGKECALLCRSRWSPCHKKKKREDQASGGAYSAARSHSAVVQL